MEQLGQAESGRNRGNMISLVHGMHAPLSQATFINAVVCFAFADGNCALSTVVSTRGLDALCMPTILQAAASAGLLRLSSVHLCFTLFQ